MSKVNSSIVESIALKLWNLEKMATYDKENNAKLWAEITGIHWVVALLDISKEVSSVRQDQVELSNKTFQAGRDRGVADTKNEHCH
jgi:hypothetical protein